MTNQLTQKIAKKIKPFQLTLESILVTVLIIGVIFNDTDIGYRLIIISIGLLATLYFFMSFVPVNSDNKFMLFINKLSYLSYAIGIVGILFTINHYPGASTMLTVGLISIVFGLLGLLWLNVKMKKGKFIDFDLLRAIVITIVFVGLMTFGNLPDYKEISYPNDTERMD